MIPLKNNIHSRHFPLINYLLILVNSGIFAYQLRLNYFHQLDNFVFNWAVIPVKLIEHPGLEWPTLFGSMFLHGGWLHLLGNMLYLYIFGNNVEDKLGHLRYLIFYLTCGLLAGITQIYMFPQSAVPLIGASGAIAGIMGAYFFLHPFSRIRTLIPIWFFWKIVEIPAFFYLAFWFVLQLYTSHLSPAAAQGGVAWWAHIGGFLSGGLLLFFFRR
ncbi:MAG: rhomboid family intramembrane serine protease [Elusimicrobiota bacterium]